MNDRLYRSRSDRMLAGVAGGVADHFELDPSLVRVGWAILVIVSGGIFLLIYIVMAIVVPEEPVGAGGWAGAGGWSATSGWSSSWPSSTGTTPGPAGPPPGPAAAAAPGDPSAAAAPSADPGGPGAAPPAAGAAGPGFATPITGAWTPASSNPPDRSARDDRRAARDARRAARRASRGYATDHSGTGGIIAGFFLVALGLFFLVRTFVPQLDVDRYWPAGLVVLGLVLVGLSIRRTPGGNGP